MRGPPTARHYNGRISVCGRKIEISPRRMLPTTFNEPMSNNSESSPTPVRWRSWLIVAGVVLVAPSRFNASIVLRLRHRGLVLRWP